jgi:hypothetical protein
MLGQGLGGFGTVPCVWTVVMDSVNSGTWDRITGILVVFSSGWFSAQKCMYKWSNSMTFFSEWKQLD